MGTWRSFLLGHGDFRSPDEITSAIRQSKNFNTFLEDPESAEPLLIFQTSQQQTWLVASTARLYCILDDLRADQPRVQWSVGFDKFASNELLEGDISTRAKTDKTGILLLAGHQALFSKKLFTSESIEKQVIRMAREKVGQTA